MTTAAVTVADARAENVFLYLYILMSTTEMAALVILEAAVEFRGLTTDTSPTLPILMNFLLECFASL